MAFGDKKRQEEKVLDVDAAMSGTLSFKDPVNLRINGKFDGNLDTKGSLTIGETAIVNAKIFGENITIAGRVKGQIVAKIRLELLATAVVEGDVQTGKLIIQEGALFQGHCYMIGDSFNCDELARYLEVEVDSIMEWASSGKVPALKDGSNWRFERKAIDEWLAAGKLH